jgi:pimeloyl-ACP methyl ester carboxylesterase
MGRRMWRGLGALGLAALLVGSLYAYERFVRRSPLRFTYLTGPISDAQYGELIAKQGWAKTSLEVAPSLRLNGLLRRPQASDATWVLFYPGNDEHMLTRGQTILTKLAEERDWGLAVFAYRGFDSSGGVPEIDDLAEDAHAILEYVAGLPGASRQRLHVVGFSIGGHLAVRAVAAANQAKRPVASLSLLASVNDIVMLRRAAWQKFALGDPLRTAPFLSQVPAPVLVLQGSDDQTLAGPGQSRDIAKALGERSRYQEFGGVGHEALLDHEPALQAVREFIAAR